MGTSSVNGGFSLINRDVLIIFTKLGIYPAILMIPEKNRYFISEKWMWVSLRKVYTLIMLSKKENID